MTTISLSLRLEPLLDRATSGSAWRTISHFPEEQRGRLLITRPLLVAGALLLTALSSGSAGAYRSGDDVHGTHAGRGLRAFRYPRRPARVREVERVSLRLLIRLQPQATGSRARLLSLVHDRIPSQLRGYDHLGDLDYHDGRLYVPLEGAAPAIGVFDSDLNYITHALLPNALDAPWCAIPGSSASTA
jgi:hypothetical protein